MFVTKQVSVLLGGWMRVYGAALKAMYTPSCLVQIVEGFSNQAERFVSFSKGFLVSKTCCEMFVENSAK